MADLTLAPATYSRHPGVAVSRNGRVVAFLAGRTEDDARAELGLPPRPLAHRIVEAVEADGPITVRELARRFPAAPGRVSATVATMAARGRVVRIGPGLYDRA